MNSVEKESEPAVIEQRDTGSRTGSRTGSPIVEDEPENDRHSDIEIIQPNADPLPVVNNHMTDTLSGVQDMSGNEDKNEISADEIKISRETMLKMMMEINQLKQAHIARENSEQKKSDEVNSF